MYSNRYQGQGNEQPRFLRCKRARRWQHLLPSTGSACNQRVAVPTPDHLGVTFQTKFPQYRTVAVALIVAVAAERQIRLVRQRGEHVQFVTPIGLAHLATEFPAE